MILFHVTMAAEEAAAAAEEVKAAAAVVEVVAVAAMEKAVIKVYMNGSKSRPKILKFLIRVLKLMVPYEVIEKIVNKSTSKRRVKAMKIAATSPGVISVAIEGEEKNQLVVTGERFDAVNLASVLKRNVGFAQVISFGPDKKE
ncbi:heavy metal-associated isoprenylated plant protein 47 [Abeliophyllum distichum]|uniref:Heavy metal-associated isoprenylated plant protein 47 n=1 Tax=Abeliophyllum distichum TaxID=126358 RepID=A0ABD1QK42_9LAMI